MADASTTYIYVNGEVDGTKAKSGSISETTNAHIGARSFSTPTNGASGQIDDVRIYDHALSGEEVFALYQNGLASLGSCAGTTEATLEYDSSQNNYKFCDGADWVPVADNGTVGTCSGNPEQEYDAAFGVLKWCNGSNWIDMSNVGTLDDGLVGHWKLNESGNVSTAADSAGTNTGTLTNFPADPSANWVTGRVGGALDFDGVDDVVDLGNKSVWNLATTDHSFSAWFKIPTNGVLNDLAILERFTGGSPGAGYLLFYDLSSGQLQYEERADGGNVILLEHNNDYRDDTWHHVAVTVELSSALAKMYVDGVFVVQDGYTGNLIDRNEILSLGAGFAGSTTSNEFLGLIDDARVYNRALDATEITALYNGGAGCQ